MKRQTLALLNGVLVAATFAFVWTTLGSAHRTRAEATRVTACHVPVCEQILELEKRLGPAAAAGATGNTAPAPTPRTADSGVVPTQAQPVPDAATLMTQHPELRRLFERTAESFFSIRFRPLLRATKLSAEQTQRFRALVTEQDQQRLDLESAARTNGLPTNEAAKLRAEQTQRHSAEVREVLGEEAFAVYEEHIRIEPIDGVLAGIAMDATGNGVPLGELQAERLRLEIARASASYKSGGPAHYFAIEWPEVVNAMRPHVTPEQLKAIEGRAALMRITNQADKYQAERESTGL